MPELFYKGRSQEKNVSCGWNFSCFTAQLIKRDLICRAMYSVAGLPAISSEFPTI